MVDIRKENMLVNLHKDLFVKKAYEESLKGKICVLLIPVRTSSIRWQKYILDNPNAEIRFMPKRFKFSDSSDPAMFCSAIVIFYPTKFKKIKHREEKKN